jgi:hypothetical protein
VGGDERGLLGLAFHPQYATNGRFFVYYTEQIGTPGDQVLAEYARSDNPDLALADVNGFGAQIQPLLHLGDLETANNGGMIDFGRVDGMLYVGTGDGGGAGDRRNLIATARCSTPQAP